MALFHSLWMVLVLVLFLGIVAWAWSSKRKQAFDEAARIPLEEDEPVPSLPKNNRGQPLSKENRSHG